MLALRPSSSDNAQLRMASKTPGRVRNQPLPSTILKENAAKHHPLITRTGKQARTIYPSTPAPKGSGQSEFAQGDGTTMKPSATTTFRLTGLVDKTNKTPFMMRQPFPITPIPSGKLQFGFTPHPNLDVPASVLRPSSTRKSLRVPRSSSSKGFETPDTHGRRAHWDVSFGDLSVEAASSSSQGIEVEAIVEEEEIDADELLVMRAPVNDEPPYHPGFDLPDYTTLGAAIMAFSKRPTAGNEWVVDWESPVAVQECSPNVREGVQDPDAPFPRRAPVKPTPSAMKGAAARHLMPPVPKIRVNSKSPSTSTSRPSTRVSAVRSQPSRAVVGRPAPRTVSAPSTSRASRGPISTAASTRPPLNRTPVARAVGIDSLVLLGSVDAPSCDSDDFRFVTHDADFNAMNSQAR